ncbi:alternative ribosome rescue aminoacyl-tRNA hydrolase ArfB [Halobacteriovorax sp. GB3]|uniref:alternative ribosome rescue aminoacyl-tRNA hydrolase ArfB n=1 Tax=Halobacteriovorax sp. GB3 TaxID=2719615 RepID=UPI002361D35D|nr:alternative ribosome rescue aminoacyl-tRNA hydrolase ArfB [Halobacteriovorax sp. GB3]MDD0854282.1 alternative ribosome rescue aminoacyl-tRNA hydrolase ArfB [Halobacteriovorax sp. GB3]
MSIRIPNEEFQLSFSRSSGAGGQNVNKVNTKVTLTWDYKNSKSLSAAVKKRFENEYSRYITAEKLVKIVSQKHRSQQMNIDDAISKLHVMLANVERPPKRRVATKPTKGSIKRRLTGKKNKSEIKKNRQKVKY